MSKQNEGIDIGALEHAVLNEPIPEIPGRPSIAKLIATQRRATEAEIAAELKSKLLALLSEQANILQEAGLGPVPLNIGGSIAVDAFGRHYVSQAFVQRLYA